MTTPLRSACIRGCPLARLPYTELRTEVGRLVLVLVDFKPKVRSQAQGCAPACARAPGLSMRILGRNHCEAEIQLKPLQSGRRRSGGSRRGSGDEVSP
jgi:hypothetical protein